jgi:hypothetical protein
MNEAEINEIPTRRRVRLVTLRTVSKLRKKMRVEMAQGLKPSVRPPTATTKSVLTLTLVCTTSRSSAVVIGGGGSGGRQSEDWRRDRAVLTRSSNVAAIVS